MLQAKGVGERCVVPLSLTSTDVKFIGKLSEGAESTVHQATWKGRDVAVKKARISTSADLDRFKRELEILASFHHPSIVPLLGARALPPDYWLVLPLAAAGNVRHALYDDQWRPSWRQVLELAYAVASGMEAVHMAGVIHRDIKPANLLLPRPLLSQPRPKPPSTTVAAASAAGEDGIAPPLQEQQQGPGEVSPFSGGGEGGCGFVGVHIADFGLAVRVDTAAGPAAGDWEAAGPAAVARRKPSGGFHKERMVGTLEYMAPELLLRTAPASKASDVYAWAVTVNEVATGVVPFSDCTKDNPEVHTVLEMGYGRMELAAAVCAEGLRPLLPRRCPPAFAVLMAACWAKEPAQRPSFTQVRRGLEQMMEELPRWEQQQQQHWQQGQPVARALVAAPVPMTGSVAGGALPHQPRADKVVVHAMIATETSDGSDADDQDHDCAACSGAGLAADPATKCAVDVDTGDPTDTPPAPPPLPPQPADWALPQPAASAIPIIMPPFTLCPEDGEEEAAAGAAASNLSWLLLPASQHPAEPRGTDGAADGSPSFNGAADGSPAFNGAADGSPAFNGGAFEAVGPRDSMEDRYVLLYDVLGRRPPTSNQRNHQQPAGGPGPQPPHSRSSPEQHHHPQAVAPPGRVPQGGSGQGDCWGRQQQQQEDVGCGALPSVSVLASLTATAPVAVPVAAVFDGHRGAEAAEFCRARLPGVLRAAVLESKSPVAALRLAFVRLEEEYHAFWRQHRQRHPAAGTGPHAFPGTTALVALLAPGGRLFIANAGDCRAVLCRRRRAVAGSRDHTGLLEDERQRLRAAGCGVTWQHGGWRIGASGLQVTRCIGDFDVKGGAPGTDAAAGVTAVPEVTCVHLQPELDHFLILASDGLWDVMSVQEATGLVYDTVKDPTLAAKRLATEALMRGSADNVTVVVVFLTALATVERVYGSVEGEAYDVTGTAYGSRVRLDKDRHMMATMDEVRDTY